MAAFRTVVAAVDFSESARVALAHADRLARASKAALHVVSVVDSVEIDKIAGFMPFDKQRVVDSAVEHARKDLPAELKAAGVKTEATIHTPVARPFEGIRAVVEEQNADLLVVGYHGRSEEDGGPGTIARKCVRHSPCHVLLTRRGAPDPFRRVAVAIDFSDISWTCVEQACAVASVDKAQLILVHAHANPFDYPSFAGLQGESGSEYAAYVDSLNAELERWADRAGELVPRDRVRTKLIADPRTGRAIARWCKEEGLDLAVIGTVGKAGLRYLLLGSTAERVLDSAPGAVLTVRHRPD